MGRGTRYPAELREHAVRMVTEVRPQYPSDWSAIIALTGRHRQKRMSAAGLPMTIAAHGSPASAQLRMATLVTKLPTMSAALCAGARGLRLLSVTGFPVSSVLGWQSPQLPTEQPGHGRVLSFPRRSTLSAADPDVGHGLRKQLRRTPDLRGLRRGRGARARLRPGERGGMGRGTTDRPAEKVFGFQGVEASSAAFQLGLRRRSIKNGGRRPMRRIPPSISRAYLSGFK